jgi:hypothetical protein
VEVARFGLSGDEFAVLLKMGRLNKSLVDLDFREACFSLSLGDRRPAEKHKA